MSVKIGNKELTIPVIQGGMGVGISLGGLSGAVAKEGGMGTISIVGIGYREEDFYKNNIEANTRAFSKELKKAREIAQGNGIIAVNIMYALTDFQAMVKAAVKEKIDAIVVGAGLPLDLPSFVDDKNIMIAPIISSARALKLIIRNWTKKYNRYPDFVVLEGKDAGGHLGFKKEEIENENYSLEEITKEVVEYLNELKDKIQYKIPLFVGGSFFDGNDLNLVQSWGADGIQMGTRFIATVECDASEDFKKMVLNAEKDDIVLLHSPVGLPARGIKNEFIERIARERVPSKRCINCLKTCNPRTTDFCISDALINSVKGETEKGLFFSGSLAHRITEITTVHKIFEEIKNQWRQR